MNHLSYVLLFCFIGCLKFDLVTLVTGSVCDLVSCGEGSCKASSGFLGFECECRAGWNKASFGSSTFPSCTVPNCTINYGCGASGVPSPPPPPPPPAFNLSDPCSLAWCGQGTCMRNGTRYSCECDTGFVNLLTSTSTACVQQCSLGADCAHLGIAIGTSPPSNPPQSDSSNGSSGVPRGLWIPELLSVLLMTATLCEWF